MDNYKKYLGSTPQTSKMPGKNQVKNNAGGYVFKTDDMTVLKRFLCLGTTGGTYYVGERDLTIKNMDIIVNLLNFDYKAILDTAAEYSKYGRIVKNETAILVLALGMSNDKEEVREYAASKFNEIIRIPTHLFTFMNYIKQLRGTGRLVRNTISKWYLDKPEDKLVYHILKYQNRAGWSHLDVLRLAHAKPKTEFQNSLFGWLAGKRVPPKHELIEAFMALREEKLSPNKVVKIIKKYGVTWEFVPTLFLGFPEVWKALLPNLPMTALVRNLGRMSSSGALRPLTEETNMVVSKLTDPNIVKRSMIHPIQAAIAAKTYSKGAGVRGHLTWTVNTAIKDALNELTMLSFDNVKPTGKRYLLGLDVSNSMSSYTCADVLTAAEASAVMALATVKAEKNVHAVAFSHELVNFPLSKTDSISNVLRHMRDIPYGRTDCALPMIYATENKIPVDVFVIYTDNETYYGKIHPAEALKVYRRKMGINAKLVVVGMVATNFSIADPADPYQLDIAGFDSSTPKAISEFSLLK